MDLSEEIEERILCEICKNNEKVYKCPRCAIFTCSLACCVLHKTQTKCNGKRDRASFVSMREFGDNHLRNDFHFLEDVLQTKDSAERTLSSMNESAKRVRRDNVFYKQKQLIKAAASRGTILNVLPRGMSKSVLNSSKYYNKNNRLLWRVHMVFAISSSFDAVDLLSSELHNCQSISSCDRMSTDISDGLVGSEAGTSGGRSFAVLRKKRCQEMVSSGSEYGSTVGVAASVGSLVGVCLDSVDENTCLEDIICGFIYNSTPHWAVLAHTLRSLRAYINSDKDGIPAPDSGLVCLIQKIPSPASCPVFQEVPLSLSIREALRDKTVLEFPTFVVSSPANLTKVKRDIATIDQCAEEIDTNVGDPSSDNNKLTPTVINGVMGLECYGSDDDNEIDIDEDKPRVIKPALNITENDDPSSSNDDDEENSALQGGEDEFFQALQELEGADPEALKAIIAAEEEY